MVYEMQSWCRIIPKPWLKRSVTSTSDPDRRRLLGSACPRDVEQFEMNLVAVRFLAEIARVDPIFPGRRKECK